MKGRFVSLCRLQGGWCCFFLKRAFSLVEVVLALGVVSFALLGLIALLPMGVQSTRDSLDETNAINVMSGVIADWQAAPFSAQSPLYHLPLLTNNMTTNGGFFVAEDNQLIPTASGARYRIDYQIVVPKIGLLDSYQGWLKVSWPAGTTNDTESVETLVTFPQP